MAKIVITKSLFKSIEKKFSKSEANKIVDLIESVGKNPHKGKALTHIKPFVIKELKYGSYRFYFITNGSILKFGTQEELTRLLIKFVKMSDKKNQQKIIEEIKNVLTSFGFEEFK